MFSSIENLLLVQSILISVILIIVAIALVRKNQFKWSSTGFWTLVAIAVYFVANPLASLQTGSEYYRVNLSISGGLPRAEWIGFVTISGIIVFFIVYLKIPSSVVNWGLDVENSEKLSIWAKLGMIGFLGFASYSLLSYRSNILSTTNEVQIIGSRFVGSVTGWQYIGDSFFFMPVAFFIMSRSKLYRVIGWILALIYVVISFRSIVSRFTIISMVLIVSIASTVRVKRHWPNVAYVLITILGAAVLVLRGHTSMNSAGEFLGYINQIPNKIAQIFSSVDSSMLASWYLESFVKDHITGFDYGLPVLNYVLFGMIPNRIFPQKYFLIDWLRSVQTPVLDATIISLLYGAKSSLLGSFYANGGFIGVLFLMGLMGFLCRKIDGMLSDASPAIVKAIGVCWVSVIWMVWGSADYWGVMAMGSIAIPGIFLWLVAPKFSKKNTKNSKTVNIG